MKPGDYRRDYAAYCAALARARYDFHVGRAPELQLAPLHERYADLWTRERLAELEQAQRDTPAQFETERTALRRLLNVARLGYIAAQTREVAAELARCEAAAQIAWPDARVAATDAPTLIANEPDAPRRRRRPARPSSPTASSSPASRSSINASLRLIWRGLTLQPCPASAFASSDRRTCASSG